MLFHLVIAAVSAVVVWNPWDKKAKAMQDFGDGEYKHMLCVEPAAVDRFWPLQQSAHSL